MSQTERILYLDKRMRLNGSVSAQVAADHFEISVRQIKRDIEALRDRFSAPIVYSREKKGYCYETAFDELETAGQSMVMFYVMIKALAQSQNVIPVLSEEILKSLEVNVPNEYREMCERINYQIPQYQEINSMHFVAICDALKEHTCLEIEYLNVSGDLSIRLVEPLEVINYGGIWYMACFDRLKKGLRTFNVSRIRKAKATDEPWEKHKEGYPNVRFKSFSAEVEQFLSGGFGIFLGAQRQNVRIEFSGTPAHIVRNQVWHSAQKMKNLEDGKVELQFPAADFTEVLAKILYFGKNAKPLEPPELVERWKEEVRAMASMAE